MEQSISSLAFKGSVVEAIHEAKRQKKLFVVYLSGENPDSIELENSTWKDPKVADSLSKYCILLNISEGSTDAANFSAIYPQKAAPCITAIGYNGVQVWKKEGVVVAEDLASSLEKAWLNLHIQETTATLLSAAVASKNAQQLPSETSKTPFEQGSSSNMDVPSASSNREAPSSEARTLVKSETMEKDERLKHANEPVSSKTGNEASTGSAFAKDLESSVVEQSDSSVKTVEGSLNPVKVDPSDTEVGQTSSSIHSDCPSQDEKSNVSSYNVVVNTEVSQMIGDEERKAIHDNDDNTMVVEKACIADTSRESTDVHLNIRLPDAVNLQEKFSLTSTLSMVKDYVAKNLRSSSGSYDLAIPYPRKVFDDEDLSKTLSELGLLNRQALIVVPRDRAVSYNGGGSSSQRQSNSTSSGGSSDRSSEGYLAFVKRILSYMNPFSYLGGGSDLSNSTQESENRTWQYGPNPTLQNDLRGRGRPYTVYSPNQSSPPTGTNNERSRRQTPPHFGSNIHTLKHDEDDSRFADRNTFWNGNSTQFGGDDNSK